MSTPTSAHEVGHVFLARSRVEQVVHDAAIVPTDRDFHVREYWTPVIGCPPQDAKPGEWPTEFARSSAPSPVWFIDVGDVTTGGTDVLIARALRLVETIRSSGVDVGEGRSKLRIAMPVLGTAGGGLNNQRGEVIRSLVTALADTARRLDIDVILVTPSASIFSAAQHVRGQDGSWDLDKGLMERARNLAQLAKQGHLALFLGAGVSIPAGLPTWKGLLHTLLAETDLSGEDIEDLPVLDQAELISMRMDDLGQEVAKIASRATRPSLAHALLAGFGCQEVVTTNYDRLYEQAVAASGRSITSVFPWQNPEPGHSWILKMHGDVRQPDSIVLTRRHFVGYDANTRPAGALLQALLQTRHLLFVGASLNDDNVSRLVYEVDRFRSAHGLTGNVGTFLDIDGVPARQALWSTQLNWIEFSGESFKARARQMEVFLDAVAAHAATDASWLLDRRFSGMLSKDEGTLAAEALALHERASKLGPVFAPLVNALKGLGVEAANDEQ